MSETELSVICKNCGSEVSPYVTECPYCGARLRKRAPKLERRGRRARRPGRAERRGHACAAGAAVARADASERPYATLAAILGSAVLLLVQKASGDPLAELRRADRPARRRLVALPHRPLRLRRRRLPVRRRGRAWRSSRLGVERRLGSVATAVLLVACGSLGHARRERHRQRAGRFEVIAGGNGMALGAVAAWFALRRAEAHGAIDQEYDVIGVAVAAAVLLALPLFDVDARTSSPASSAARSAGSPGSPPRRCAPPNRLLTWLAGRRAARGRDRAAARSRSASPRPSGSSPGRRRSCSRSSPPRSPRAAGSASRTRPRRCRAATVPDPDERIAAVRSLLAEEARMGMMVGVAVGWALHEEMIDTEVRTRRRELRMEIKFHGHSCFELSEGEHDRPGRPVPEAQQPGRGRRPPRRSSRPTSRSATATPTTSPTRSRSRSGPGRTASRSSSWRTGSKRQGVAAVSDPEPGRHGRVRLGLDQARPRLAHEHAARLRRGPLQRRARRRDRHRGGAGDQDRRRRPSTTPATPACSAT